MIFALIKNGIVENTIVAELSFIGHIASQWDFIIRVDELEQRPGIGWAYDGVDFTAPIDPIE